MVIIVTNVLTVLVSARDLFSETLSDTLTGKLSSHDPCLKGKRTLTHFLGDVSVVYIVFCLSGCFAVLI